MPEAVSPQNSLLPERVRNPLRKASRPALVRWIHLLESLRTGSPPVGYDGKLEGWRPNDQQFAKAFGCHPRTILRDRQALIQCGYNIEFDERENSFHWINKTSVEFLPLMAATEDEVIALITALAISHSVLDAGTAENLRTFLLKLEQHLGGFVHPFEAIQETIQFKHVHVAPSDTSLWTRLQRFILDQKGLKVIYASPFEENEPRELTILPLVLVNLEGIWYLYVRKVSDETREGEEPYRLLRINRIQSFEEAKILVPEGWNRKAILDRIEKGVGAWQGGEEALVRLRIADDKIGFMRERAWYPGHTFHQEGDGSWILSFVASQVEHLVPFVLQWGPHVEVLEPEGLRAEVAWTAQQVAMMHSGKSGV